MLRFWVLMGAACAVGVYQALRFSVLGGAVLAGGDEAIAR